MRGQHTCGVGLAVLGRVMAVETTFAEGILDVDGGGSVKHSSHISLIF